MLRKHQYYKYFKFIEKFDVLKFWSSAKEFPTLQKVARWVLAIPASEASDERIFSDAGYIMKPRTTSLNPGTLSEMVFVHANAKLGMVKAS